MQSARPRRSPGHWLLLLTALATPLALLTLGRALDPDRRGYGTHEQLGFAPCMPMERWNLPCPACGVTTALSHAAHGAPLRSLRVQPLGLVLLTASLAAGVAALATHARGGDLAREVARRSWRGIAWGFGALALFAWTYKVALLREWIS